MTLISRDWSSIAQRTKTECVKCFLCGKPSRSDRGNRAHYLACHATSSRSERNWNIGMKYFEDGVPPKEIASFYNISVGAVLRVLNTLAQYPYHYELDPEIFRKVTPINSKARTA